jgi:MarR family transcriptional regulator, transcriptional regulator for hemolysin
MKKNNDHEPAIEEYRQQTVEWFRTLNNLIRLLSDNYSRIWNREYGKYGISHSCFSLLYRILNYGREINQKKLLKEIPLSKQTIAADLKLLEEKGYITRQVDSRDKRNRKVQLTEKGITLIREMLPVRRRFHSAASRVYTGDEAEQLIAELNKLNLFYANSLRKLNKRKKT